MRFFVTGFSHWASGFLRFIHVVACVSTSFLFIAKYYFIAWIDHLFFMHSLIDGQLDCFYFLVVMNNTAVNTFVIVLCWHVFISRGYLGVEWLGHMVVTLFTVWRTSRLFQSGWAILHALQQCARFPISPPPCQSLSLSAFLIAAILVGVKWCLTEVSICISLMIKVPNILSSVYWPYTFFGSKLPPAFVLNS